MSGDRLRELLEGGPELPWSDWAMTAAGLAAVCAEIEAGDRREIVELGSGVSTIVIARLLRERGAGRITAVEHDRAWAGWVGKQLEAEGLGATAPGRVSGIYRAMRGKSLKSEANVVVAPLTAHPRAHPGALWYEADAIASLPEAIDLVLVDGPPAGDEGNETVRYPALPVLEDSLAPGAAVILDDIDRPGERAILTAWEEETPFRFELLEAARIALGRLP